VGNLSPLRDFLDVRDVVKAYILAVEKAESGEVYNVSSAKGCRIKDILDMLLSFSTAQVDVVVDEARVRVKEVNVRIGDNTKFAKQTGWQPSYEIKNTLKEILQEFRRIL
jgi:GDP-4-dehydro-6-deoxy-D-mannose reductase